MPKYAQHCYPVKSAASYSVIGPNKQNKFDIVMTDDKGHSSIIDTKNTHAIAYNAAQRWQKIENRAVLKSQGFI